jgi:hypothetical protein
LTSNHSQAAECGDLKAKFVYLGAPPAAQPVVITKDQEVCGKHKLVDESLVVNKTNGGIQNIIAFIYRRLGDQAPPIHPDYAALKPLRLDNLNCRFVPHVLPVRTGQKLILGNKDPVAHNTKIDSLSNPPINPLIPAGGELEHSFADTERLPARVSCSIHPWMSAWVVVQDNPYVGVTNKDGVLEIKNVPTGTWTFRFWQEKAGYIRELEQDGTAIEWSKGRLEVTITPAGVDLGTLAVKPSNFEGF